MIVTIKIKSMFATDSFPEGGAYLITTLTGGNVDLDLKLVKVSFERLMRRR